MSVMDQMNASKYAWTQKVLTHATAMRGSLWHPTAEAAYVCGLMNTIFFKSWFYSIPAALQACAINNACSHICAVVNGVEECHCPVGFELSIPGGTQCVGRTFKTCPTSCLILFSSPIIYILDGDNLAYIHLYRPRWMSEHEWFLWTDLLQHKWLIWV